LFDFSIVKVDAGTKHDLKGEERGLMAGYCMRGEEEDEGEEDEGDEGEGWLRFCVCCVVFFGSCVFFWACS